VEEILLCRVIERFRPSVETQRLRQFQDIQAPDLDAVDAGMTRCSRWEGGTTGHDHAFAANEPMPGPDELSADIAALDAWVKTVENRRKKRS
jgi:hypothetical protein